MTNATKETLGLESAIAEITQVRKFLYQRGYLPGVSQSQPLIDAFDMALDVLAARANPLSEGIGGSQGLMASGDLARGAVDHDGIERSWQPIETAPTDGTYVLAVVEGRHNTTGKPYVPCAVQWDGDHWSDEDWQTRDGYEPTHWMPLPAPPADGIQGERS